MATYQILVKLIDGHTRCLQFPSPTLTGQTLKQALTLGRNVRLVTGTLELADETLIAALSPSNLFPSVALLPRLRGGKGGFGSLLRGAATKAGQKKTNNFDACSDMSGRRLRHVNAEKKLEEWKAEADDRRMEKLAEEFLKKKAKETKKGKGKNGEIEKYLEKCRQDSERCMDAVDQSVRESFALYQDGKRKVLPAAGGSVSKRMKIWMGKKKVDESDSDDEEEEDEDDKEKSMVLDDALCTALDKEEEGSSAAVLGCANSDGESSGRLSEALDNEEDETSAAVLGCANSDGESSGRLSERSNLEEVNGSPSDEHSSDGASNNCNLSEVNEKCEFELPTAKQYCAAGDSNAESAALVETEMGISEEVTAARNSVMSTIEEVPEIKDIKPVAEMSIDPEIINKETIVKIASILEEPLDFDKYNSFLELEALGMERLKSELQSRGMKCGGTLQERAARLFLLKTTPFEKLPKKVLAAKAGGK